MEIQRFLGKKVVIKLKNGEHILGKLIEVTPSLIHKGIGNLLIELPSGMKLIIRASAWQAIATQMKILETRVNEE